jgi:hypothetical protein
MSGRAILGVLANSRKVLPVKVLSPSLLFAEQTR